MKVVAIIQARLGSTRFPRKVLAPLRGKALIQHVVDRTCEIEGVDDVVVAAPYADGPTIGAACNVRVFSPAGVAEQDVLGRYVAVASLVNADVIVRVTADCPVLNPAVGSLVLDLYATTNLHQERFASNDVSMSQYPDGWDVEVFSRALLERASARVASSVYREHVTLWMKQQADVLQLVLFNRVPLVPAELKLSVDTPEDLARIEAMDT